MSIVVRFRRGIRRRCTSRSVSGSVQHYNGLRCEAPRGHAGDHACWVEKHIQLRWAKTGSYEAMT